VLEVRVTAAVTAKSRVELLGKTRCGSLSATHADSRNLRVDYLTKLNILSVTESVPVALSVTGCRFGNPDLRKQNPMDAGRACYRMLWSAKVSTVLAHLQNNPMHAAIGAWPFCGTNLNRLSFAKVHDLIKPDVRPLLDRRFNPMNTRPPSMVSILVATVLACLGAGGNGCRRAVAKHPMNEIGLGVAAKNGNEAWKVHIAALVVRHLVPVRAVCQFGAKIRHCEVGAELRDEIRQLIAAAPIAACACDVKMACLRGYVR
jgi:hypothetical protein